MDQIMRELVRKFNGGALAPEQIQGLIRAGYVYRNGEDHILTDKGRDALAAIVHDLTRFLDVC
jgi:predicted transcriptional regulator